MLFILLLSLLGASNLNLRRGRPDFVFWGSGRRLTSGLFMILSWAELGLSRALFHGLRSSSFEIPFKFPYPPLHCLSKILVNCGLAQEITALQHIVAIHVCQYGPTLKPNPSVR